MVSELIRLVTRWAQANEEIRGVALVGSYARNQSGPNSDIDLLLLAQHAETFRDAAWVSAIDWPGPAAHPPKWADEQYGAVWSRRIWLHLGFEIELSFAPLSWADVFPVDKGTERVVSGGCLVLYDPDGLLERLTLAIAPR